MDLIKVQENTGHFLIDIEEYSPFLDTWIYVNSFFKKQVLWSSNDKDLLLYIRSLMVDNEVKQNLFCLNKEAEYKCNHYNRVYDLSEDDIYKIMKIRNQNYFYDRQKGKAIKRKCKPVHQYDLNNIYIQSYRAPFIAAKLHGYHPSYILRCCRENKTKLKAKSIGYYWSYNKL